MAIKLNIAPVTFKDKTIYIEEFRYSDERFNQLLNEYRKTHPIQRLGDRIQVIPLRKDSASIGGHKGDLILSENFNIVIISK